MVPLAIYDVEIVNPGESDSLTGRNSQLKALQLGLVTPVRSPPCVLLESVKISCAHLEGAMGKYHGMHTNPRPSVTEFNTDCSTWREISNSTQQVV